MKNAYEDYLASRTLLNHNLIVQGAILANTAIEKYFKAILTFKGDSVKHTHSINGMLPSIKNYDKPLYDKLDIDFIDRIDKCYTLRYLDAIPANFNLALRRKQTLSELDYVMSLVHNKINVKRPDGADGKSLYQHDKESGREELCENNYVVLELKREDFLLGIDDVYQIQFDANKNFIEFKYQTDVQKN